MAGRSQASNLTGMLSGIGDTIGEMGEPGRQYIDTFRRGMAPTPDMSDSASLQEYAQWARRNGYDEEADKYMALSYKQKEVEKQEAKDKALGNAMAGASQAGSIAMKQGAQGDLGNVDATIASLNKRLSDPAVQANPNAVSAIVAEVQRLENNRPAFESANTEAIARGVVNIDRQISALDKSAPDYAQKKAGLEEARARFMAQPNVEKTYQTQKLELMELENKQNSAMWQSKANAVIADLKKAGTDPNQWAAVEAKYPQFAAQIAAVAPDILAQSEAMERIRSDSFRVESLPTEIDHQRRRIEESSLTERQKADLNASLDGAERLVNTGGVHKEAAINSYANVVSRIDQMMNQELAAEAGAKRAAEERATIAYEKAQMVQVTMADKIALALDMTGEKDASKLDDDDIQEAEAILLRQYSDWERRTAIAAGKEPPQELDAEDKAALKKAIDEGEYGEDLSREEAVQIAAFDLMTQGYRKEDVVKYLTKEIPAMNAAVAEQLIEDMWTDLNNVDYSVRPNPAPAEQATAYRKERGLTFMKPFMESLESRYRGFIERRSGIMHEQTRPDGPSIAERQRSRLSPSIGPMGEPEDYDTKLRRAREGQPNSPYQPKYKGEVADPYIHPAYRKFGG